MRTKLPNLKPLMAAAMAVTMAVGLPTAAQAQIPGLLPSIEDVDPLPIDGVWRIRENGELIVIGDGHAYAVDGWTHAFVFQIMPRQVVLRNLRENARGDFVGDDLPLMSKVTLSYRRDGSLRARTKGLVPVTYHLEPVSSDDDLPWDDRPEDPIEDFPPSGDPEPDDWVNPW